MLELSIIIPHYNEEKRIKRYYNKYLELINSLDSFSINFEVILEEDGSKDNTKALLKEISKKDKRFVLLTSEKRLGKGGGLIQAFRASRGRYIIMLDADFPVPNETIIRIYDYLEKGYDIVIPSRRHPESKVSIPNTRKAFSYLYNILVRSLFGLRISDTQVGVKGFKREVLEECFPRYALGFSMDVEILVRAWKKGYKIIEIPTVYVHGEEEHVNILKDSFKMGLEVLKLWASLKKEGL